MVFPVVGVAVEAAEAGEPIGFFRYNSQSHGLPCRIRIFHEVGMAAFEDIYLQVNVFKSAGRSEGCPLFEHERCQGLVSHTRQVLEQG